MRHRVAFLCVLADKNFKYVVWQIKSLFCLFTSTDICNVILPNFMNKPTKILLTIIVILLVTGLAFYPRLKPIFVKKEENKEAKAGGGGAKTKDAKPGGGKGGPTPVEIMVISDQNLDDKLLSTGTIIPNEEVEIRSEISGRVTAINFKEGDFATKGQVLVRINDDELQAQLQKLGYQKKLAEVNEERQKKLLEKEAISQRDYDVSLTNLNSINADIENLKAQIAKTVIRAPFNGRTGLRYISNGSYLTPSTRVTVLTSQVPVKIDFSIPAKYAAAVRRGSRINFTVEGGEQQHVGTVYAVESKIDPNTRTLTLRATSPNSNGLLIPGSFAKVEIVLSSNKGAIVVPTEAVVPDAQGHKVFVVRNNKTEPVKVQIGTRLERSIEIVKGLSPGDTLITAGVMQVKPGGEIDIRN
jgi:membrane fusion protein, multidrug efflux system